MASKRTQAETEKMLKELQWSRFSGKQDLLEFLNKFFGTDKESIEEVKPTTDFSYLYTTEDDTDGNYIDLQIYFANTHGGILITEAELLEYANDVADTLTPETRKVLKETYELCAKWAAEPAESTHDTMEKIADLLKLKDLPHNVERMAVDATFVQNHWYSNDLSDLDGRAEEIIESTCSYLGEIFTD